MIDEGRQLVAVGFRAGSDIDIRGDAAYVVLRDKQDREVARAVIDATDVDLVRPYRWFRAAAGYAQASPRDGESDHKLWMHRVILGLLEHDPRKVQTDHIDGDRLNNRRRNLRVVDPALNAQNAVRPSRRRLRGVILDKRTGRYCAQVQANYQTFRSAWFSDVEDAIVAARSLRAEHFTHHVEERHV